MKILLSCIIGINLSLLKTLLFPIIEVQCIVLFVLQNPSVFSLRAKGLKQLLMEEGLTV